MVSIKTYVAIGSKIFNKTNKIKLKCEFSNTSIK